MRILVLGGTGLTGTAIVASAHAEGHDVTAVHRGRASVERGAVVPDGVTSLVLDRTAGHESLASDDWDAVIDVSGYVPAVVRDALVHLDRPGRPYVYVSTVSVYASTTKPYQNESARRADIGDPRVREQALADPQFNWSSSGLYGECKALCELELESAEGPVSVLRPVVIAGPYDHTWRFPYWVDRARHGGTILAPAPHERPTAIIDVRDLADFAVRCATEQLPGTFNLSPRPEESTFRHLVGGAVAIAAPDHTEVAWIREEVLLDQGVEPWVELPFWLPESSGSAGMQSFDARAAYAAGFTPRPYTDTARDVLAWLERTPADQLPGPAQTLPLESEAELLAVAGR